MGFYVYITRRKNPFEDGPEINAQEWREVVRADASLTEKDDEWSQPPAISVIWNGHPEVPEAWFVWSKGQIQVKNPDELMIVKQLQLAKVLDAAVISETGEVYNADGSHKGFIDGRPW